MQQREKKIKKAGHLLGKITENKGFQPSEKNELKRQYGHIPTVNLKKFGLYFLYSTLIDREIATLKTSFVLNDEVRISNSDKKSEQLSFT
ncbi:MAG: hypothetical protein LBH92_05775 [Bacteroidales bacterium]|jgi:hypothetical protein|nr:hypothetical protein [Bacteroidales bacterium]